MNMIILVLQFTNFFNDCLPFLAVVNKKAEIWLISPDGSGIPRFFCVDITDSGTAVPK
jgi:hypothetical protein